MSSHCNSARSLRYLQTVMYKKSKNVRNKKKGTLIAVKENEESEENSKQKFSAQSPNEISDYPKEALVSDKKRAFVKRKSFPFNIQTWNDSLSDCPSTPFTAAEEEISHPGEGDVANIQTMNHQEPNGKKGNEAVQTRTPFWNSLDTKKAGLQLEDIETRYTLGRSSMYAWSSLTDVDNVTAVNECQWGKISASQNSLDDRISRRIKELRLSTEADAKSNKENHNSFSGKPPNRYDDVYDGGSESGFPTHCSGVDSGSINTVTSSISIPIPGFGESSPVETNSQKETASGHVFVRIMSWCCLLLRDDPDSHAWSCRNDCPKSCEGDHFKGKLMISE